jgi:8-oxo-dGTP pyrophosphatase MutT (NUDIX family)
MRSDFHRCAGAILVHGDRVLLCHRSPEREWFPDVWDVPGGHIEPGESGGDTIRRELEEELGIVVQVPAAPLAVAESVEHAISMEIWRIEAWDGVPTNRAVDEHDRIAWFTRDEIAGLDLADESYRALLAAALGPSDS